MISSDFQVGNGSRGDVTILPTLVINNVQYRGQHSNRSFNLNVNKKHFDFKVLLMDVT